MCLGVGGIASFSATLATRHSEMVGLSWRLLISCSSWMSWLVLYVCSFDLISALFGHLMRLGVYSERHSSARLSVSSSDRFVLFPPTKACSASDSSPPSLCLDHLHLLPCLALSQGSIIHGAIALHSLLAHSHLHHLVLERHCFDGSALFRLGV